MNRAKHLIALANAIDKVLPCDKYASAEEWMVRNVERLRDVGYTIAESAAFVAGAKRDIELREEARSTLGGIIARKCNLPANATDEARKQAQDFVLGRLKRVGHFVGIRAVTDFARYARHVKYFSKKSSLIRGAYHDLFDTMRAANDPYLRGVIYNATSNGINQFATVFGWRYWRLNADDVYDFYGATTFITCKRTKLKAPTSRMLAVVIDEDGRTERMHPSVSSHVIRDSISGQLVWHDAVDWVRLENGEKVWRRFNEASGAIYLESGVWQRGATNGRIAGYHGATRQWRERPKASYRRHVGVELECGFKTTEQYKAFLSRFVNRDGRFANERPFMIEQDSSLNAIRCGVEIISEPLELHEGYQAANSHWRWLLDKLVHGGAEGWKNRQYAGIHVNMDVSDRSPADILRYVVFVHNAAAISQFVSGRKYIFGAAPPSDECGLTPDAELRDLDTFATNHKKLFSGGYEKITADSFKNITGTGNFDDFALNTFRDRGKYQPVRIRSGMKVLETRIFGSNIRYEGFMACVEYCVGGMEFTTGLPDNTDVFDPNISARFRTWLSENREKYPNLASRIGVTQSSMKPMAEARPLQELVA